MSAYTFTNICLGEDVYVCDPRTGHTVFGEVYSCALDERTGDLTQLGVRVFGSGRLVRGPVSELRPEVA